MWTPKRILLLAAGFLLFLATYQIYDYFLGGIDSLSELEAEYLPLQGDHPPVPVMVRPANRADLMLRQAFGEDCKEIKERWDKLEVRSKGMVLAFEEFTIDEGRVRLKPLSLAVFGKNIPGKFPEINTVRADVAYLTFDKPVATITDMTNRKIVAGELEGNIHIKHNRRTPQINDDIFIDIPHGPVYYRENQQRAWIDSEPSSQVRETRPHLWTTDYVILEDHQSRPEPVRVTAKGMDLFLTRSQPETTPAAKSKAKSDSISGMDQVILRSSVDMRLYVDAGSGFLSPTNTRLTGEVNPPASEKTLAVESKPNAPPAERSKVTITTQGPFNYHVAKDIAQFDLPAAKPGEQKTYAEHVVVTRFSRPPGDAPSLARFQDVLGSLLGCTPANVFALAPVARQWPEDSSPLEDRILCNQLEIQFRRKTPTGQQAPRDDHAPDLEIESAHATGGQVVLTSDAENLVAEGDDFYYNAATKKTVLKGTPKADQNGLDRVQLHGMWAIDKQGNKIGVRELHLVDQKGAQQASGKGQGEIYLFDKATGKYPLHAKWTGSFTSTREGPYELITLIGGAEFRDDEHGQFLKGDNLQVWLLPAQPAQSGVKQDGGAGGIQQSRRPHRLEATGHVLAKSPDLYVHNTDHLIVNFKDGALQQGGTPVLADPKAHEGTSSLEKDGVAKSSPLKSANATDKGNILVMPGRPGDNSKPADPNSPAKPSRPMDLSARIIETEVVRNGPKNELDQLRAEGTVRVKQEPATLEDKGVDIRGDTLQLNHFPEGSVLTVTGENLAQLQMDKLFILGTEIIVDQVKNEARVDKTGVMVIDSDTDFEGNKLGRTVPLEIHWSKHMFFSGQYAEFHGGIEAEQENARMACQTLQVHFDRPISLKEGNKGEPAKVETLICDKSVKVHDRTIVNKRIVKDQRIECGELNVDKKAGLVIARQSGFVRIWQPGAKDPLTASTPGTKKDVKPAAVPDDVEMKLTYVSFAGWMQAKNEKHSASFVDDVKVLHMPATNPDVKIDLDKILNAMPANAFYLSCSKLDIISIEEKGKTTKEMTAREHVIIEGQDYSGRAEVVTYNEAKEQIILQGGENGKARLYKYKGPGIKPDEIVAKKIIYSRLTGEHSTDGTEKFEGRP